jgi:HD-like signal output (HDOD) protein
MNVPTSILNLLNYSENSYEIESVDPDMLIARLRGHANQKVQFVLMTPLQASEERLQLIHSANVLVDIDEVIAQFGHPLKAVSSKIFGNRLQRMGLETLPALPQLTGDKALVDKGILEAEEVYLHSGNSGQVIKMPAKSFMELLEPAEVIAFGVALDKTTPDLASTEHDIMNVHHSIQKYTSLQIKRRLVETLEIPPLSCTAQSIINLAANPDAEAEALVKIVELDPSLSAQIVGWASSPYYSAPGKINSIHDAIVRVLGFNLVLNLALGLAVGKSLKVPNNSADSVISFWRQSVYTALTMEKLNAAIPANHRGEPGLAYLTGLLNNFGYLILAHVFPSHFAIIERYTEANRHLNPTFIEQFLLGLERHQICSLLMKNWNLPEPVWTALRFQQAEDYCHDYSLYANLCFLAKRLLAANGIGDSPVEFIPAHIYERLHLEPAEAENIIGMIMESSDEIDTMSDLFFAK